MTTAIDEREAFEAWYGSAYHPDASDQCDMFNPNEEAIACFCGD